ncbi:MAG: hypothetical protein KJO07_23725, partial [Deltaproteobacteria bacterium]|nr:hypothetical protein [Deltaproteobacteria bacterium]
MRSPLVREYRELRWIDHETWRGQQPKTSQAKQVMIAPSPELASNCSGTVSAFETTQTHFDGTPFESRSYYCWNQSGYSHFASKSGARTFVYEPKLEVPVKVEAGDAWSGTHGQGPRANTRSCLAIESWRCPNGIAV